jgi:NADH-quinone oxidoreductase subunit F
MAETTTVQPPVKEGNKDFKPILTVGVTGTCLDGYVERLADYRAKGGYEGLKRVLENHSPADVINLVKEAGVRGRGGAGFPAAVKWGFLPKEKKGPHYVCVNADESEPGTFSNRPIMEQRPHLMIEGTIICAYAVQADAAYIYIRGEYYDCIRETQRAIDECYAAGLLGRRILDTNYSLDIYIHRGAGAYICGEETALLESIEGKRGYPRLRPPFPAIEGLYRRPTVINNVETLACVSLVFQKGVPWFKSIGTEKSAGPKVYSISGHVKKPGNFEAPLGVTMRELIYDFAGGIRDNNKLKAVTPGGSSVPMIFEDELDMIMDYDEPGNWERILVRPGSLSWTRRPASSGPRRT